jgi:PD-(D/E)XK nuclease superfamily
VADVRGRNNLKRQDRMARCERLFQAMRESMMLHEEITSQIIAAFYAVYYKLGYGFLEKVYENA